MIASVSAGEHRISHVQRYAEHQTSEKTVDDRGNSGQSFRSQTDEFHQFISPARVFHQIDRGKQTERNRDDQRHPDHRKSVDDRGHHGDIFGGIFPGEHRKLQMRNSIDENITHQQQQCGDGNHRRCGHKKQHKKRSRPPSVLPHPFASGNHIDRPDPRSRYDMIFSLCHMIHICLLYTSDAADE